MGMRVLQVIDSLSAQAGSAAVPLRAMIDGLADHSIDCNVLTAPLDGPTVHAALLSCDVVHVHGWGFDAARQAAKFARRRGTPYVISPYGALTESPHRRPGMRHRLRSAFGESGLVRAASLIAAINEFEAETLRDRPYGARVEVLPAGIDFDAYAALDRNATLGGIGAEERVLLVLGPVGPLSGGVPLLRSFAELGTAADGWRVVFAGEDVGDWRKQMEAAVRRKGGSDRVNFTRAADLETQTAWLGRADAIANVAPHPTCATSLLQALACGIPILATTTNAPDALDGDVIVCDPARESITRGLRGLLSMTPDDRRSMGLRAREAARSRLDVRAAASRFADHYGRLSGHRSPSGMAAHVGA